MDKFLKIKLALASFTFLALKSRHFVTQKTSNTKEKQFYVMVHTYCPSTQKAKAGGLRVLVPPRLYSKPLSLKIKQNKIQNETN